jgi:hypothetical protein
VGFDGAVAYKLGVFAVFALLVVAVALNNLVLVGLALVALVLSMRGQRRFEARKLHGIKRRRRRRY